jgi:hypothetical protein
MLLVCVCSYLNSVLRYTFLIFYTYYLDTLYLHEQGYEDLLIFFKARRGPQAKTFGKRCSRGKESTYYLCHITVNKELKCNIDSSTFFIWGDRLLWQMSTTLSSCFINEYMSITRTKTIKLGNIMPHLCRSKQLTGGTWRFFVKPLLHINRIVLSQLIPKF